MKKDYFLQEGFVDRIKNGGKRFFGYFPVWKDLLFLALIIIAYLAVRHFTDARLGTIKPLYTNKHLIQTAWSPSSGEIDRYLLEIRDTRFFTGSKKQNAITMVKNVKSKEPSYQLTCEHDHSYQVRVTALDASGSSSPYSEESALLICDQKSPRIVMDPLPSPAKLRYPSLTLAGTFDEPNLESITINGTPVRTNALRGRFSAPIDLNPGTNYLTLRARDLAGNTTEKQIQVDYAPLTIVSLPSGANIYWNGNYAYLGVYSDTTPQSFNQALEGKQVLRLTYPGFNDYYATIDFSDLTTDTYTISLSPFSGNLFSQMTRITSNRNDLVVDNCSYPFVVDYDMDGKKDLLIGTKEGTIALFSNRSSDSNPVFADHAFLKAGEETIDVGTHAAPFIIDFNNDGAKDLVVGNGEGALVYYVNTGSNTQPVFASPTLLKDARGEEVSVDSYCTPFVTDWNGDNKKDLLLGSGEGTLSVYLNEGSDADPFFAAPLTVEVEGFPLTVDSFAAPFVTDWNGNGKRDLLVGNGDGFIHLYLDISTTSEPEFIAAGMIQLGDQDLKVDEGSAAPFLIDWNNDGKNDLLVGSLHGTIYLFSP